MSSSRAGTCLTCLFRVEYSPNSPSFGVSAAACFTLLLAKHVSLSLAVSVLSVLVQLLLPLLLLPGGSQILGSGELDSSVLSPGHPGASIESSVGFMGL